MQQIPPHLKSKWLPDHPAVEAVRESALKHYYKEQQKQIPGLVERDIQAHLLGRLVINRERVMPWLDSVRSLAGSRVLEIGCGTGASTVALAEQGAQVTALDIDIDSIKVGYDRCAAYGVRADFIRGNAGDLSNIFFPHAFDWIIIYATLEHMTHAERIGSLKSAWQMLAPGSFLAVVDSPNRLWFYDDHTSLLPFYHWLPDELAFEYSRFSSRDNFKEIYRDYTPDNQLHFLRRGRGVSFHEFELAIAPRQELNIAGCMSTYHRELDSVENDEWQKSTNAIFEALLHHACPDLHQGFLQPYLDIAFRKK